MRKSIGLLMLISLFMVTTGDAEETNYPITRTAPVLENDRMTALFDPRAEVQVMRDQTPQPVVEALKEWTSQELEKGFARTYVRKVQEYAQTKPVAMVVEVTRLRIPVAYEKFTERISPEYWGRELAGYLGGAVQVVAYDDQGRAVRQIERMVLHAPLKELDMTKSEVLEYSEDKATVWWRVFHSDNHTTLSDIGYVEFAAFGRDATMVTFQSAHRLYLPEFLTRLTLAQTFMKHLIKYKQKATSL